LQKSPF